jgi:hypothetical protein
MKIRIILIGVLLLIVAVVYFAISTINYYLKQTFYADSGSIVETFKYEVISGKYSVDNEIKYIYLKDLDFKIDTNRFDIDNSYIAFKDENREIIYISTIIGKGRFENFAYINTKYDDMEDIKNISNNKNIDTDLLLKELKAVQY